MKYIIYESLSVAQEREQQLTLDGIRAGYFPKGERYDFGGLITFNKTDGRAAIEVFKSEGLVTPLSVDDIMPCNYEPLFTMEELSSAVNSLSVDWTSIYNNI